MFKVKGFLLLTQSPVQGSQPQAVKVAAAGAGKRSAPACNRVFASRYAPFSSKNREAGEAAGNPPNTSRPRPENLRSRAAIIPRRGAPTGPPATALPIAQWQAFSARPKNERERGLREGEEEGERGENPAKEKPPCLRLWPTGKERRGNDLPPRQPTGTAGKNGGSLRLPAADPHPLPRVSREDFKQAEEIPGGRGLQGKTGDKIQQLFG